MSDLTPDPLARAGTRSRPAREARARRKQNTGRDDAASVPARANEPITLVFSPITHPLPVNVRLANLLKVARRRFRFNVIKRGSEMPVNVDALAQAPKRIRRKYGSGCVSPFARIKGDPVFYRVTKAKAPVTQRGFHASQKRSKCGKSQP